MKSHVTRSSLKSRMVEQRVKDLVNDILRMVDAKLVSANNDGLSSVNIELPIARDLDASGANVHSLVYAKVLDAYGAPEPDGRGFAVTFDKKNTVMTLQWDNGPSAQDVASCEEIIARYCR